MLRVKGDEWISLAKASGVYTCPDLFLYIVFYQFM